jgi:glucose-1-phosphate cytidylyltransferase
MTADEPAIVPVIILCGGQGTRMRQYDADVPKPLVWIGDRPLLWHVMNTFAYYGQTHFILALGHRGEAIAKFFVDQQSSVSDLTVNFDATASFTGDTRITDLVWRVSCIDTGRDSCTAARIVQAVRYTSSDIVMVTYADGVADIDIRALLRFHRGHGRLGTVTAVHPPGRFGVLKIDPAGEVLSFEEKPAISAEVINGGYMVFDRRAVERYMEPPGDVMLEAEPLTELAADGQLMAYRHHGFWQPVDTPAEREKLDRLWAAGKAPWVRTPNGDRPSGGNGPKCPRPTRRQLPAAHPGIRPADL